tara:strand:- start:66 stop:224 length:159 start_codon:yes stop_codon:yes gene_type:complete
VCVVAGVLGGGKDLGLGVVVVVVPPGPPGPPGGPIGGAAVVVVVVDWYLSGM